MELTDKAWDQLNLIIDNDFTVEGKYFRVFISGKKCEGPIYSTGMTDERPDDFKIVVRRKDRRVIILMDPFSAFYLQEVSVNYIQDFTGEGEGEGFVVINHNQQKYTGKFWTKDEMKIPPGEMLEFRPV